MGTASGCGSRSSRSCPSLMRSRRCSRGVARLHQPRTQYATTPSLLWEVPMPPTVSPAFDQALRDAIALLRDVPRRRGEVQSAKRRFAAYQELHPDVPARLAVELPPGEERADYDVLLDADDGT